MTEKLRERALKGEPDKEDFNSLADQVEEFTLRFLDPLKYENLPIRRFFSVNPELDVILETAIKLEQKKVTFFTIVGDKLFTLPGHRDFRYGKNFSRISVISHA